MGKYADANLIYSALLKVDEEVLANNEIAISDIQKDLYENQIKYAQSLIESGEAKKAKSVFNKLLANNQEDYRIYLGLADSSFALGMNTYAKNYYEQALALKNSDVDILSRYAQVLYELKETDTALALLDKITDENPQDEKAYYNKGLIQFEQKYVCVESDDPEVVGQYVIFYENGSLAGSLNQTGTDATEPGGLKYVVGYFEGELAEVVCIRIEYNGKVTYFPLIAAYDSESIVVGDDIWVLESAMQ
jgi:tetratricopeptide (TPR) repeat protein